MVCVQDVQDFLEASGRKKNVTIDDALDFLHKAEASDLNTFLKEDQYKMSVQYCTLGPYDLFWTPTSWAFFTQVMNAGDVLGIRQVVLSKPDFVTVSTVLEEMKTAGQSGDATQEAVVKWLQKQKGMVAEKEKEEKREEAGASALSAGPPAKKRRRAPST